MRHHFVFAIFLALAMPAIAAGPRSGAVKPAFEKLPCPAGVSSGERIECGMLIVPENRSKSRSRSIRLPVMIFRSHAAAPAPDPIVYLPGGPGLSSIEGRTSGKGNPFLSERDQILLEGRGNSHAQPSLGCPELNVLRAANATLAAQTLAIARCRTVLMASGVDLDGYTTAEAADDLNDLRVLLGIRQWNLIGYSYGTRLAQTVLARHPEGVRSVVLDSVLPSDVNYDELSTAALRRAINLVFDGCASDSMCDSRYPDLRGRFVSLMARADRGEIRVAERILSGRDIVDAIAAGIQQPQTIPTLPRIINDAADNRLGGLLPLLQVSASSFNWGLRLSIWCGEEMPFENADRIGMQVSPALGLGGADTRTATPEMCAAWRVSAAPADANLPVKSDVPTLILAGEFDPVTPPAWGQRLLRTMPNARFVQLPGQAHGAMFNRCGGQLTLAFLRDPAAPLNLDCIAKTPDVVFSVD